MKLPAFRLWSLFAFVCLASIVVLWWTRVNRDEIPAPIGIRRDNSKPKRLQRFSDIVVSTAAESIRVDYAFLSIVRQPLRRVLPPGVTEETAALSRQYPWDDPVFDEIKGRLTKIEEKDEAAWRRSLQGFQGEFHGVTIEVVSAGSAGNSYQGGPLAKPFHISIPPKAGDPLEAGYEGHFLLAQAREDRLVGFRKASPTSVAYRSPESWIRMDVANGEMEVTKVFETMTSYCIVVLRFSAVGRSVALGNFISDGYRRKPVEDKASLIRSMIESRRRAKELPPKPVLPTLQ